MNIFDLQPEEIHATEEQMDEVSRGMRLLGYPASKQIELGWIDKDRCIVIYDGHFRIGVYDFQRHTFVD